MLYVPDSPANLISPQKLIGRNGTRSAIITTCGPMIVFSWGDNCTKTIHHNPQIDLPLMNADDSDTLSTNLLKPHRCEHCPQRIPALHSRCSRLRISDNDDGARSISVVPFDNSSSNSVEMYGLLGGLESDSDRDINSDSDSDTDVASIDSDNGSLCDNNFGSHLGSQDAGLSDDVMGELRKVLEEIEADERQ